MTDLVPEEAIKAAVIAAVKGGARGTAVSREWNRRVLEAAAPLILAAALEEDAGPLLPAAGGRCLTHLPRSCLGLLT